MDDGPTSGGLDIPRVAPPKSDSMDSVAEYFEDDTAPEEHQVEPRSLVDQVGQLGASVRDALPGVTCRDKLGCAQAVILLFDKSNSEAENELLACKLFAVLPRGTCRSHFEDAAFVYSHGSWGRIRSPPYSALEFST